MRSWISSNRPIARLATDFARLSKFNRDFVLLGLTTFFPRSAIIDTPIIDRPITDAPLLRRMPVSHPNKSDPNPLPDTLPDPELNPLLNPLLAAHMGRWAEVYFTNPPEKRDQAVSELLRELEQVSASEPALVEDLPDEPANKITEIADSPNWSSSVSVPVREPVLTCNECAYNNSPDHEFCGMCGAPLVEWAERGRPHVAETAPFPESWCERTLGGRPIDDAIQDSTIQDRPEDAIEPAVTAAAAVHRQATDLNGLLPELRQEPRPELRPTLVPKPLPGKAPRPGFESLTLLDRFHRYQYRYRLYVGALLVILLLAAFIARRARDAHSSATASPAVSAIRRSQPAPAYPAQPAGATPSASPTSQRSPIASPALNQNQANASAPENHAADSRLAPQSKPPQNVPVVASSSAAPAPAQSGAQELATAEKYLNPTGGTARDSGEAVEWLWKAVRKRNLEAALVLSDMYARGDGMPKNCDQARLLLDVAARRGGKGAAERLRNLQASGCQ
jgi:hypothetical protein